MRKNYTLDFDEEKKSMPTTVVKLAVARHGARADDDPAWALSYPAAARIWDPPLSKEGKEQVRF